MILKRLWDEFAEDHTVVKPDGAQEYDGYGYTVSVQVTFQKIRHREDDKLAVRVLRERAKLSPEALAAILQTGPRGKRTPRLERRGCPVTWIDRVAVR